MPDLLHELELLVSSGSAGISAWSLLALGVVILCALLLSVALLKSGGAYRVSLRPLPALERLKQAITDAAESGAAIHLSAGTGTVGSALSADTLAGVNVVAAVVGRAATANVATLITTASPTALPLLQAAAEQAYQHAGVPKEHEARQVRFAGDDRNAYAVSATESVGHEGITTSVLVGSLGDETLLIGERGRNSGVTQIIGTPSTRALPYAIATADDVIIGEETYAASAYLGRHHAHVASLLAEDWLRLIVVGAIIIGVILRTMGW